MCLLCCVGVCVCARIDGFMLFLLEGGIYIGVRVRSWRPDPLNTPSWRWVRGQVVGVLDRIHIPHNLSICSVLAFILIIHPHTLCSMLDYDSWCLTRALFDLVCVQISKYCLIFILQVSVQNDFWGPKKCPSILVSYLISFKLAKQSFHKRYILKGRKLMYPFSHRFLLHRPVIWDSSWFRITARKLHDYKQNMYRPVKIILKYYLVAK